MSLPGISIGFLAFDNVTQLDLTGPLQVLSRAPNSVVFVLGKGTSVSTDVPGFRLNTKPLAEFAKQLDILVVPGGFGVDDVMVDQELMAFVKKQAAGARFVCSVCTGAFILGAAGLLKGKRATTHWAYKSFLPLFDCIVVDERVVRDGNLFTGGGVTAGIDFGFVLLAELSSRDYAASVQLSLEYNPMPPHKVDERSKEIADARYVNRLAAFSKLMQTLTK